MLRYFTIIVCLLLSIGMMAQPVNDNCDGIIDLGTIPYCPGNEYFTNVDATASDIGFDNNPSCFNGGTVQNDIWFQFATNDTLIDITILVNGITDGMGSTPLLNPQIAIYRGFCEVDGMAELSCASADLNNNSVTLNLSGLDPNTTYIMRINDYSQTGSSNWGSFNICIDEINLVTDITEGSSNACEGILYDSGGANGDYSNNENYTFTICPNDVNNCIAFNLHYFNIENLNDNFSGDQLFIYDGDDILSPLVGAIDGNNFAELGGGGVCYSAYASSGCMTIQFISDGTGTYEGWEASWECSVTPCETIDPVLVQLNPDQQTIINSISTPQTLVTLDTIICHNEAYGTFTADDSDLGIEKGILLTSGLALMAAGPNNSAGGFIGDLGLPGDADLDSLSLFDANPNPSNDACILELDVYAITDELTFEYIFASEEYPEFVGQNFNDIFAFFISGPGIIGNPSINNQENIALIPTTNTPVAINNVNQELNWEYYRNNNLGQSLQYDGMTSDFMGIKKSLTARMDVTPCNTYHLKLAIADRSDFVYDSGVFISEIKGGTPTITVNYAAGLDYVIEGCSGIGDEVTFNLSNTLEDTVTYTIVITGTAMSGDDYELVLPDSISFLPGESSISFPLTIINDMEDEGIETIEISLTNDFGCGEVTYTTAIIEIHDEPYVEIFAGMDTINVCRDSSVIMEVTGANSYFWTPVADFDNPFIENPILTPTGTSWYTVEGTVGPCKAFDSVFVQFFDPSLEIIALTPTGICDGESVELTTINNANNQGINWSPNININNPNINNPIVSPSFNTTYTAALDIYGCIVEDTIDIMVDQITPALPLFTDTTVCQGSLVTLAQEIFFTNSTYVWTPADLLDDPAIPNPVALVEDDIVYTVATTSENGFCSEMSQVSITSLPADVDILQADTIFLCLGEETDITATTSTGGQGLQWITSDESVDGSSDMMIHVKPDETTTYFATLTVGQCYVTDSVVVNIDSIPSVLDIMVFPDKDIYCPGELDTLLSTLYTPSDFPDISFEWFTSDGTFITPEDGYNMIMNLGTDDHWVIRRMTNNECEWVDSVFFNIVELDLNVMTGDTTICTGESIQLAAASSGDSITWTPPTGLSCIDCSNPIASPTSTTTYTAQGPGGGPDCPGPMGEVTITVNEAPGTIFATDRDLCFGESVILNTIDDGVSNYSWTSTDPNFGTVNDAIVEVTPGSTTTYYLHADNSDCSLDREITIMVNPLAEWVISLPEEALICTVEGSDPLVLMVEASVDGTYMWSGIVNSDDTEVEISSEGLVVVSFVDSANCTTLMDSLYVVAEDCGVAFPNAFIPVNGETPHFNAISLSPIDIKEFKVFNRWGQVVYNNDSPSTGWDGKVDGEVAPADVYVYVIRYLKPDGTEGEAHGEVLLVR